MKTDAEKWAKPATEDIINMAYQIFIDKSTDRIPHWLMEEMPLHQQEILKIIC